MPASAPLPLLAAIDLGSNAFRLEVGRFVDGRYRRVDELREAVRLGTGLDGEGRLDDAAVERALACLRRFAVRLQAHAPQAVRAVATQTLRETRDRERFLALAGQALGLPIDVIGGDEEARLIYAGVALLHPSSAERLVVDVGGRSTEVIVGRGRRLRAAASLPVGSTGLSMKHFGSGRLDAASFRAAQLEAGAEFDRVRATFARARWREALGASGTPGAASQLLAASGITDGTITPEGLRWCIERCIDAGHLDRLHLPALRPERRLALPGGLAILYAIALRLGVQALRPARGALRQGLLLDLHRRR